MLQKKLKILGIIAEYNPFHNGHRWQLDQAKQIVNPDLTVVILGGNYTQRGEMSVLRREDKVKISLSYGVDLVVGIPFLANIQSVKQFALGSIQVAKKIGVTHLVFGSEHPEFPYLEKSAEFLASGFAKNPSIKIPSENYANNLEHDFAKFNFSLKEPNHLLGFYYALAANELNYHVKFVPLKRRKIGGSSSKIRSKLLEKDFEGLKNLVPSESYRYLKNTKIYKFKDCTFKLMKAKLILTENDLLMDTFLLPEELLRRSQKYINQATSYDEFVHLVKTKRYTLSRIKRVYLYLLLGINHTANDDLNSVEIWGFNSKGQSYLSQIKNDIQFITNPRKDDFKNSKSFCIEARANGFYDFIMDTKPSKLVIERE